VFIPSDAVALRLFQVDPNNVFQGTATLAPQ
jgi:hypothetical protein